MYNSVTNPNNKGFYMGRYEAGKENNKVVVKKNKRLYANIKWGNSMTDLTGGVVELSENFTSDKSYKEKVISTLVYDIQWDTTLKFFNNENYQKTVKEKDVITVKEILNVLQEWGIDAKLSGWRCTSLRLND